MQVGFDMKGQYNTRFPLPGKTTPVFVLCSAFLKQEDTLAVSVRTVYTEDIRALFATVSDLLDLKSGGESKRTLSSEEIKALDKQAVALIKKIHRLMVYEFAETPARVTEWGFDVKQTGKRTGTILIPDGREAIVAVLDRYAKTEKGRPAAERFKSPTLAEVVAVVDGLKANVGTRGTAKSQRVSATQQTLDTAARLLDLLQAAAVQIVVKQCNGQVTPDLGQWGYEVIARNNAARSSAARNGAVKKSTKPAQTP